MRGRLFPAMRAAVVAAALMVAMPGWAQQNCQDLRAIWLGELTFVDGEFHWGGRVVAVIGEEVLVGTVSEIIVPWRTGHGVVGMDRGTQYLYDFGGGNTFTLELQSTGVFPSPPGKTLFGYYRDVSRIVDGKGRFSNASGIVAQSGPYLVSITDTGELAVAVYTAELHGKICMP